MTIQVAALCDAATDYNGKLNLLGTFDTILAAHFPVQHPQCSVAFRIAFERPEEGNHKFRLRFADEDGQPIMDAVEIPAEISFPDDATFISRNFIVNYQQLTFKNPGLYSIDLALDDRLITSIPLSVKQIGKPKAA